MHIVTFMIWMDFLMLNFFYRLETAELRRLIELGKTSSGASAHFAHGSLEEATELEYLRNILFEYIMGRQPAVIEYYLRLYTYLI